MSSKDNQKNNLKAFARFSGIGIQMGLTIYLGYFSGTWLDKRYNNSDELYTKLVTLTAVFLSTYLVIKKVIKQSK